MDKDVYDKLLLLDSKDDYPVLKDSWCFVILRDGDLIYFKSPFSDFGDMRYTYVTDTNFYEDGRDYVSLWQMLQDNRELFSYHIKRVRDFELYQDCDVLVRYLKLIKRFEYNRIDVINEMIRDIVNVQLSLKRYWTDVDATDTYLLLGIVDTITDDWHRKDVPALSFALKYHRYIDDIRTDVQAIIDGRTNVYDSISNDFIALNMMLDEGY